MADILLKNIVKIYEGGVQAVTDFNLDIKDKEFVVLVGPSGCGKSTVLRMIAGLEDISGGDLTIAGRRVNNVPPKDRDIAMVFQNYALYPHMNVYDNMAFGLKLRNYPKNEIDERVREAGQILGLTEYLERKPKALSGGQRQRVAVGRAIVRKPKAFLFDEPLSNLDAKMRIQMRKEISQLHTKLQATMIYVTHDQVEAMTMGDRIVVMRDGLIQQIGEPMEIYRNPENIFVAGFIGSPPMNFFECDVKEDGIYFNEKKVPAGAELVEKVKATKMNQVTMGIRPEDFVLAEGEATAQAMIEGSVDINEPLGSELLVYVSTKQKVSFTAKTYHDSPFKVGDPIFFNADMSHVQFFQVETGQRLS